MRTAKDLRRATFELALKMKCPHIAPSLSTVEILMAIYGIMTKNDRFILSKGHGCIAWYVILKDLGYSPKLSHHPDIDAVNGVECTTGSLGHGLPIAVGMALAKKLKRESGIVYVLMGDGECQEGTTWESAMIASRFKLNNLCVVVDRNNLQTLGVTEEIGGDLASKFEAFDWCTRSTAGHDVNAIGGCLRLISTSPKAIIAHTIKGKGVSFMENNSIFHARLPNDREIDIARKELA